MVDLRIPKPEIHTGPKHMTVDEATIHYLREAAERVRAKRIWGSGVSALVATVLDDTAAALLASSAPVTASEGDECPKNAECWQAGGPRQEAQYYRHLYEQASEGKCGHSGLTIGACKSSICDCFEFSWVKASPDEGVERVEWGVQYEHGVALHPERDALAEVVMAQVYIRGPIRAGHAEALVLTSVEALPVADAILASDWLAQRDRRVAAEALREAAEGFALSHLDGIVDMTASEFRQGAVAAWDGARKSLLGDADRIEAGE